MPETETAAASRLHHDELFAPLDADHHLQRIGGGNETEVYRTDDHRWVVKVKGHGCDDLDEALAEARLLRDTAAHHADVVGAAHSIPSFLLITRAADGLIHPVVIQPYLDDARPLHDVDFHALTPAERSSIATALRDIIRRSLASYRRTRTMPDLYGRVSRSKEDRHNKNTVWMLPARIWSFLVERDLLCSHNLMLTGGPDRRVVLVDYDPIRKGAVYQLVYYTVRRLLFLRDRLVVARMAR